MFALLTDLAGPQKVQGFLALLDEFCIVTDHTSSESLGGMPRAEGLNVVLKTRETLIELLE
jgi:hypothetical protein